MHSSGGRILVLTNGVFDILHRGHVEYLTAARALGDALVVAINSDASTRRLKPGRPLNTAQDRAAVLSALACVDSVLIFDEPTPERLIRNLRPEIYCKGADYDASIPEAAQVQEYGGRVVFLPFCYGYSTSSLIDRIHDSGRR